MLSKPSLPTYETIAEVMSEQHGSGLALAAWTVGRAALMMPGFWFVGVPGKQAAAGSVIASSTISALALFRFHYVAQENGHRRDVPVKALLWIGGLAALAAVVYNVSKKKEETGPVITQPAPLNPPDVGMTPPELQPVYEPPVLSPPEHPNINPMIRMSRGLAGSRLRISKLPF